MSRRPGRPALAGALLLTLSYLLFAGSLDGQERLGEPQPLEAESLRLELDSADLELRVDRERRPQIRASRPLVITGGGELQIRLQAPAGTKRPRLELLVRPEQTVHLEGTDLGIDAVDPLLPADEPPVAAPEDSPVEADEEEADGAREAEVDGEDGDEGGDGDGDDEAMPDGVDEPSAGEGEPAPSWLSGHGVLTLRVADSAVTLRGSRNLDLELDACQSLLFHTSGPLLATVNEGSLESERHAGELDLLITDGEARFDALEGNAQVDQLAGRLSLRGGNGSSRLKVAEGAVRIEARQGLLHLDGERGIVELVQQSSGLVTLAGQQHQVRLEDPSTVVRISLAGGRLDVRGGKRSLVFQDASELEVEVEDFDGRISGGVRGGRFAVRAPLARLLLDAVGTQVSIDGLRQLQLGGQALAVDGRAIVAVQRLELSDSTVELDLGGLIHDPSFVIAGQSSVFFRMAAPCVVKIGSRAEVPARVTGCDLRTVDQTAVSPKDLERYGRGLRRLTLMLSGEPEVEVEGR